MGEVGHLRRLYGVKLHVLCATKRVPISYELGTAITAEVRPTKGLSEEAKLGEEVARKLFLADPAYRGEDLEEDLAEFGDRVGNQRGQSGRRPGVRQQIEIRFSSLKRTFGLGGETLATTVVGLATRKRPR